MTNAKSPVLLGSLQDPVRSAHGKKPLLVRLVDPGDGKLVLEMASFRDAMGDPHWERTGFSCLSEDLQREILFYGFRAIAARREDDRA